MIHVDGQRIVNPCHCGNRQFRQALGLIFDQCRVVRCTACGQLRTDPEPNDLDTVYSQESDKYNIDHINDPERREQWAGFARGIIDQLDRMRPERGRLLDVGCGYGDLLFEARKRHWNAEGLEINAVNARYLQEQGFTIYDSFLEEQQVPENRFDVVVFSQVLEHVPRPNEFLKAVERVLKPGGLIFVAVPCFWSPIPLLLKRSSWYALLPREHVWQFSERSLVHLLARHGFRTLWRNRGCSSYWGKLSLHPRAMARWVLYRAIGQLRLGDFINVVAVTDKRMRRGDGATGRRGDRATGQEMFSRPVAPGAEHRVAPGTQCRIAPSPERSEGSAATMKPDVELLLCCARSRLDERDAGRLRSLAANPVPWEDLCRLAIEHGLGPLLYWHLRARAAELAPPAVLARLQANFQMHVVENLRIVEELSRLLREFERVGLRAIPWKGCALGLAIYSDMALRKAGDLDLLVPPQEFNKATEAMLALGYRITTPRRRSGRADGWDCYEFRFVRPDGRITVEIPWRLPPRSRYFQAGLSFDEIWERREQIGGSAGRAGGSAATGSGKGIPGLPAEEMLLCLCVHGARHQWDRLMWVCDIAELLRARPRLDWDRVQRQARALGYRRLLSLGLLVAAEVLDAPVPEEPLAMARADGIVPGLKQSIHAHYLMGLEGVPGRYGPFPETDHRGRRHYEWSLTERPADRIRFWLEQAAHHVPPNEKDRAWISLPDQLGFLYYLLRPVRLLTLCGTGSFRHRAHQEDA